MDARAGRKGRGGRLQRSLDNRTSPHLSESTRVPLPPLPFLWVARGRFELGIGRGGYLRDFEMLERDVVPFCSAPGKVVILLSRITSPAEKCFLEDAPVGDIFFDDVLRRTLCRFRSLKQHNGQYTQN